MTKIGKVSSRAEPRALPIRTVLPAAPSNVQAVIQLTVAIT